jgi:DNA-binding transcriptional LysR family regulator
LIANSRRKIDIVAVAAKARASKSIIASVNDSNLDLWFGPMNLRSLDLNLLVVFDRLMETRSVTGTARMLGLTQSTVSTALNRLRAAAKERLLERQGNKMVPTHAALAIWPEIRAALNSIETNLTGLEAFDPTVRPVRLRLGLDEYAFAVFGDRLFKAIHLAAPQSHVEFLPIGPPASEAALNEGSIDLAIGASWTPLPGLRVERLFAEEFVALVDAKHPTVRSRPTLERYLAVAPPPRLFGRAGGGQRR